MIWTMSILVKGNQRCGKEQQMQKDNWGNFFKFKLYEPLFCWAGSCFAQNVTNVLSISWYVVYMHSFVFFIVLSWPSEHRGCWICHENYCSKLRSCKSLYCCQNVLHFTVLLSDSWGQLSYYFRHCSHWCCCQCSIVSVVSTLRTTHSLQHYVWGHNEPIIIIPTFSVITIIPVNNYLFCHYFT